jgi:glycosyltransferase involved in cell wall biosynthesis
VEPVTSVGAERRAPGSGPASPAEAGTGPASGVRLLILMPNDPERMRIGGIASFVRGFVKFAPPDFDLAFVGVTADRPLWQWRWIELEGRQLRFLPVAHGRPGVRSRVPVALRYAASLFLHRDALRLDGWIASFHRPGTDLALRDAPMPMWRVVHLAVEDLSTTGSESRWRRLSGPLRVIERRAFRRMRRIYVVNEAVAERYRRRFPEVADRIHFLPNWADPTIFRPVDQQRRSELRSALAADLELPAESYLILFAGRLEGQKDPMLLARAFAAFRARHPAAVLLIAGEGSLEHQVRGELTSAAAIGAVRFVGTVPRERLAELMQASDTMLITSAFETGPTVGLEALACGLPVVTTAVGEVSRVVAGGGAGSVAPERSAEALAEGLSWNAGQPRDRLRDDAVAAAAPYLADRVLEELYDYNRGLAQRRGLGG